MSRIIQVIEQVKGARQGEYAPWIYNDDGHIKDEIICGESLVLLEELKDYEIEVTDEWIQKFIDDERTKSYNTYNYGACISDDFQYHTQETEDSYIIVIAFHLRGDIRSGYSDYFAVKFNSFYEWRELESMTQHKMIADNLMVDIDILHECYEVYDYDKDETIGSFCYLEVEDLLAEIKGDTECTAQNVEN